MLPLSLGSRELTSFQALKTEGIDHMILSGGGSDKDRKTKIEAFQTGDCRVLVLSPVGAAGLNLHAGKALIIVVCLFLD